MTQLRSQSMREQAYQVIREKILRQEYDLGDPLNIVALSRELGVSNTPIREALSMLEKEGLIVTTPNAKVRVIPFNLSVWQELNETASVLLLGCYDLCLARNKIPEVLARMQDCIDRQRQLLARQDDYEFVQATIAFDQSLMKATGNHQLQQVFDSMFGIWFLMVRTNQQQTAGQRENSIVEHERILAAVASGDELLVKRLIREHFDRYHETPTAAVKNPALPG